MPSATIKTYTCGICGSTVSKRKSRLVDGGRICKSHDEAKAAAEEQHKADVKKRTEQLREIQNRRTRSYRPTPNFYMMLQRAKQDALANRAIRCLVQHEVMLICVDEALKWFKNGGLCIDLLLLEKFITDRCIGWRDSGIDRMDSEYVKSTVRTQYHENGPMLIKEFMNGIRQRSSIEIMGAFLKKLEVVKEELDSVSLGG